MVILVVLVSCGRMVVERMFGPHLDFDLCGFIEVLDNEYYVARGYVYRYEITNIQPRARASISVGFLFCR